jgi:uncharacterized damage-inducible protein DinB
MNQSDLAALFDYNYWANARVLQAAAKVKPDRFVARYPLSQGSLRGALVHIYGTELVWRKRCHEGISLSALPLENEFSTLDVLRSRWQAEEQAMRAFLASLSDEDVNRRVQYKTTKGVPYENVLWHLLVHVVNHGTQFRAEAAVALTDYGCSPGDLDLLLFWRERAA